MRQKKFTKIKKMQKQQHKFSQRKVPVPYSSSHHRSDLSCVPLESDRTETLLLLFADFILFFFP